MRYQVKSERDKTKPKWLMNRTSFPFSPSNPNQRKIKLERAATPR
jgi:hypothetical protein